MSLPIESASPPAFQRQSRRRRTIAIAVAVVLLLAALLWLLLQPSAPRSPARQIKNVIFGRRIADAVEKKIQDRQGADGNGSLQGGNAANGESDRSGNPADGEASGSNEDGSETGSRGQRRGAGSDLPANVHNPDQPGPDLDAPPERSIGWLDAFFGRSPDSGPVRAGEGGTGTRPGTGNTNDPVQPPTTDPTAAEITQREPDSQRPRDLEPQPRDPPRTTNRPVPASNATLNDNLERLLRQHRAGTGDLRISLTWSNHNDLDLHVVDPSETEIYYQRRRSPTGGVLDIDMNASPPLQSPAVENVYWPERGAPSGRFRVYVNHFRKYDAADQTPFTVRILIRGRTTDFRGTIGFGEDKRLVHEFTLAP